MSAPVRPADLADVRSTAHMADKSLGEVVREGRVAAGISLRELARRLDVTPSYVSDIENDRRVPSEEVLGKIAHELGLDREDLVSRAGRLPADAERYMRQTPAATTLFRRITEQRLDESEIRDLMDRVDKLRSDRDTEGGGA